MWLWFHRLGSPPHAYRIAGAWYPWLLGVSLALIIVSAFGGLVLAPPDYQQGDAFRILYVHAPSAYLSMMIYMVMATASAVGLIWRIKVAFAVAAAVAPVGASFTFLALFTGAIWGEPMWGTWWVWDARLTSELILLFLYFGYMALRSAFDNNSAADRASSILAIVGVVNIPIIHYSVEWWSTLHQGATIMKLGKPTITPDMLWPLLTMFMAYTLYFGAIAAQRLRAELLRRELSARWVRDTVSGPRSQAGRA